MKPKNQARNRRWAFAALVVVVLLLAVFLPGPSGVVRLLSRQHRAGALDRDNARLERRIDSLKACAKELSDPVEASRLARDLFGALADSSPKDSSP